MKRYIENSGTNIIKKNYIFCRSHRREKERERERKEVLLPYNRAFCISSCTSAFRRPLVICLPGNGPGEGLPEEGPVAEDHRHLMFPRAGHLWRTMSRSCHWKLLARSLSSFPSFFLPPCCLSSYCLNWYFVPQIGHSETRGETDGPRDVRELPLNDSFRLLIVASCVLVTIEEFMRKKELLRDIKRHIKVAPCITMHYRTHLYASWLVCKIADCEITIKRTEFLISLIKTAEARLIW